MNPSSINAFNHPFWRFSLQFYEQPKVQALCLALQDEHGLDVNLLLFACWLGSQSRRLQTDSPALTQIRDWQRELVRPLRELRRAQSKQHEAGRRLRRLFQEVELKAEQGEQWLLYQALSKVSDVSTLDRLQLTWDNLLDVAGDSDQSDSRLKQRLRDLADMNQLARNEGGSNGSEPVDSNDNDSE